MKFLALIRVAKEEPIFTSGLLIAGDVDPKEVRRQLSRWKDAGKVIQLRRGVYALAEPYRSGTPHPFLTANRLVKASYVSLESALAWYGMIPENVPLTTSVTTQRPGSWRTSLGTFSYRHIKAGFFHSYSSTEVSPGCVALLATREKALCDLVHLTPGGDSPGYIEGLRLQNLDAVDMPRLLALAAESSSPKLDRAVRTIRGLLDARGAAAK